MTFAESDLEEALLTWLREMGWQYRPGPDLVPDSTVGERASWDDVLLRSRLRDALHRLNPHLPEAALDDAYRKIAIPPGSTTEAMNHAFHLMLTDGIPVEYLGPDGRIVYETLPARDCRQPFQLPAESRAHRHRDRPRRPVRDSLQRRRGQARGRGAGPKLQGAGRGGASLPDHEVGRSPGSPVHHRLADRVRADIFICVLAYYVRWYLERAWAPLLFKDEDKPVSVNVVAPAQRSDSALAKASIPRLANGSPVHSFRSLLADPDTVGYPPRSFVTPPKGTRRMAATSAAAGA